MNSDGVWAIAPAQAGAHENNREEPPGGVDCNRLFLSGWGGGLLGLRPGARLRLHNAHPVYGRGRALHGLAASVYTSIDALRFSALESQPHRACAGCLWRRHWRRGGWEESCWMMEETLPRFERKFRGLWDRGTLLAGGGSRPPPVLHVLQAFGEARRGSDGGGDIGSFFEQGLCSSRDPSGGDWGKRPCVVTMAELRSVGDALAAAVQAERVESGEGYRWGHRRLGAAAVADAFAALHLGGGAAGSGAVSLSAAGPDAGLRLLVLGRLRGTGVSGGMALSDATGSVSAVFDGAGELEPCYAEQLWLAGGFSLVVEFSPAATAVSQLRWYLAMDLNSARCIFRRSTRSLPAFAAGAAATETLWALVTHKSTLSSMPTPGDEYGGGERGEGFFYVDVELLDADRLCADRGTVCTGTVRTRKAQLRFGGGAAAQHYPFLRLLGCYEIRGAVRTADFAPPQAQPEADAAQAAAAAPSRPPPTYEVGVEASVDSLSFVETGGSAAQSVSVAASLGSELPHHAALGRKVELSPAAVRVVTAVQKRAVAAAAEALLSVTQLLSAPLPASAGSDEWSSGSLVNLHGVVMDRQTRSSENLRWAGFWRGSGGVGQTVMIELGQVGSAFDTVKVYIDCYRGGAAVGDGLVPGVTVVLRRVERLISRGSGQLYCRFLPCSGLSIGSAGALESSFAAMDSEDAAAWLASSTVAPPRPGLAAASRQEEDEEEGWTERQPRRYLSELVAPPKDDDAAAGSRGRRGAVVHVVARAERLLRLEMYWQCVGCGQRLPSAAPLQEEAQCAGGACARAARTWVAEGCVAIDDGTAECRLWADGETLTDGVLRVAPSLLAQIKAATLRLGPQTYSAAAEDDLVVAAAGSLHSRRSMHFQEFLNDGGGAGNAQCLLAAALPL